MAIFSSSVALRHVVLALFWASSTYASSPCSNAPYAELLFVSAFSGAEAFCSQHYPVSAVTVTAAKKVRRHAPPPRTTTTTTHTTSTSHSTTTRTTSRTSTTLGTSKSPTSVNTCTGACAAWSSLVSEGGQIISTLCSCIEKPSTITVSDLLQILFHAWL
jgi:hypothetical protein